MVCWNRRECTLFVCRKIKFPWKCFLYIQRFLFDEQQGLVRLPSKKGSPIFGQTRILSCLFIENLRAFSLGQNMVVRFTKASKISFSMINFRADFFLQFSNSTAKTSLFGWLTRHSFLIPSIKMMKSRSILLKVVWTFSFFFLLL